MCVCVVEAGGGRGGATDILLISLMRSFLRACVPLFFHVTESEGGHVDVTTAIFCVL